MTLVAERCGTLAGYCAGCRCEQCHEARRAYHREWRAARLADPNVQHGNRVTYLSGCRCQKCRAANAAYALARKDRLAGSEAVPHGTVDGYGSYRCRCDRCLAAKAAATRDHYLRHQLEFFEKVHKRLLLIDRDKRKITPKDIARLLRRFNGCCAYCGSDRHVEIDHVVPLSRGGRHAIGNLIPACRWCNRSKSNHLLIEWRRRRDVP